MRLAQGNHSSARKRAYQRSPESCWSRAEWHCFAGTHSKAQPSSKLLYLLKEYRRHWNDCEAQESPETVLKNLEAGMPTQCKYLFWSPTDDGLGNHMLSLVAAFTYALLTFRVLLVEPAKSVSAVFCQPFVGTPSWELAHLDAIGGGLFWGSGPFGMKYSFHTNPPYDYSKPPPTVLPWHLIAGISDTSPIVCSRFHKWALGASAIVHSSNMFWTPGLYYAPHLRRKLEALFPSRTVFSTLAPFLLHPNNRVWGRVTELLRSQGQLLSQTNSDAQGLQVGVQFRAQFGVSSAWGVAGSAECISRLLEAHNHMVGASRTTLSVFLASLDPEFKDTLGPALESRGISPSITTLTEEREQKFGNLAHNEEALVEMLSLAFVSDALVLTPRSTFGYAVTAFSGGQGFYLPDCIPAVPEPCFLQPPGQGSCGEEGDPWTTYDTLNGEVHGVRHPVLQVCPDAAWVDSSVAQQPSRGVVALVNLT